MKKFKMKNINIIIDNTDDGICNKNSISAAIWNFEFNKRIENPKEIDKKHIEIIEIEERKFVD